MRLYIDTETLPAIDWTPEQRAAGVSAPANYKDPDKIAAWIAEHADEAWRKTGLHPLRLRLLAIAWAVDDGPVSCLLAEDYEEPSTTHDANFTEAWLVRAFDAKVGAACAHGDLPTICGHNVAGFDLPALLLRAYKYDCPALRRILPRDRYDRRVLDTMSVLAGPAPRPEWLRLADVSEYLGLAGKAEGLDGSKVYDAWREGRLAEIGRYCAGDVELCRDVMARVEGR